ncbi:MAG: VCBS repeat-containing protein [Bacteroidales bacterium]|jgi:hypothetical protein|nr:VCBS repeat-containing protein [Bacteroidales bacterium]
MSQNSKSNKKNKVLKDFVVVSLVVIVLAGLPVLFLTVQAKRSGLTLRGEMQRILTRIGEKDELSGLTVENSIDRNIVFLEKKPIGEGFVNPPLISNLSADDLDNDGLLDVVVCDARSNSVSWIRQYPEGTFNEIVLDNTLIAPAHLEVKDFDGDGDKDIMVAVLGLLFPSNDKIGSVVVLENDGTCNYRKHIVEEKIARVSDVRACDLDGDGDMDLAAVQFGYDDGETRWIENLGNWNFQSHLLQHLSGPINVEPIDIENDNDIDLIVLVSQEWEEIYLYLNDGKGNFETKLLFGSSNEDFGSSGIYMADMDHDGDKDILYTNGDAFDYIPPQGRPWHGVQWLENKGDLTFEYHRLATFVGAYNARPADIDRDGDLDIFVVSAFNLWENLDSQSFIWLENDGDMRFSIHNITNNPSHIITMEMGDFNNDGLVDMVTGGMHAYPPYDRMSRVMLWINNNRLSLSD